MSTFETSTPYQAPDGKAESEPAKPGIPYVITDAAGVDSAEQWSESLEGAGYGLDVSYIHLSTTKVDAGPPLHQHPYAEMVMIMRGRALFTVGTSEVVGQAAQTLVIPANTPHTFRTIGPDRYQSIATHLSPDFITELLEPDNSFR